MDLATIQIWWRRYPETNIGIATGAESGLVVVDIDPPKGGEESWRDITAKVGTLPLTAKVRSGGSGWHYYLKHPDGNLRVKNLSGIGGFSGVDVKADGRYIVAPPSRHIGGDKYFWQIHPDSTSPAKCPQWLLKLLNVETARLTKEALQIGKPILVGSRNESLTRIGGGMRGQGAVQEEIEAALLVVNQKRCQPPLSPPEVARIAQSVSRAVCPAMKATTGLLTCALIKEAASSSVLQPGNLWGSFTPMPF
jgi:putative DNA primase/helicase